MARDPIRYRQKIGGTAWLAGALVAGAAGCSTVEPGANPQIAQVVFDEDFFYCQIQPKVLSAQSCASGDPSQDMGSACHATATSFHLLELDASEETACDGNRVTGTVASKARNNYAAAQAQMRTDVETASLYTHPTKITRHPRQIFDEKAPEAELLRQWAERASQ